MAAAAVFTAELCGVLLFCPRAVWRRFDSLRENDGDGLFLWVFQLQDGIFKRGIFAGGGEYAAFRSGLPAAVDRAFAAGGCGALWEPAGAGTEVRVSLSAGSSDGDGGPHLENAL